MHYHPRGRIARLFRDSKPVVDRVTVKGRTVMRFTIKDLLWFYVLVGVTALGICQQIKIDKLRSELRNCEHEIDRVEARVNHVREDHNNLAEDFEIRVTQQRPRE